MLAECFHQLDDWLGRYRDFWQFQPFHERHSRWQQREPALQAQVAALSADDRAALLQDSAGHAAFLQPWIADSVAIEQLCELPPLAQRPLRQAGLDYAVDGRKWRQIQGFAASVPAGLRLLEWCAGKGHLGRLLAANGAVEVTALEWQAPLCQQGERLAARAGVAMAFACVDVLQQDCRQWLAGDRHALALHACGDLHHRLLHQAVAAGADGLSLAPCCFNRIADTQYRPFSRPGQASALTLARHDLKLPLRQTVTAGRRERQWRRREVSWRLAFDSLQRELRGEDSYLPLPAVPKHWLAGDFAGFAGWAAQQKALVLPAGIDWHTVEQQGEQRWHAVQQMEFVQHRFQRPLELWLLLDKALYLQEQGYQVTVGRFCDYRDSPRNWMIQARRGN